MTQRKFGLGFGILVFLTVLGVVLALYRFAAGIGAVSNLNQGYPWGFWIGFDILAGIALAAGGFVVAGLVHIFGGEKYHPLVRPAILTAFIGYLLFITSLLVDLGRPWAIWHQLIYWQPDSPMFEVGWCVMSYTTVLLLEFLPVVFERFGWRRYHQLWQRLAGWVAVAIIAVFSIAVVHDPVWIGLIVAALVGFQILVEVGYVRRDPEVPTLLIMAGIIFSTLHQSSLGTLFVMVPHKLSALWYSPILPVLFLVSAVMTGMAMVIVESTLAAWYFKKDGEVELLRGLARGLTWTLALYLVLRLGDLAVRGAVPEVLAMTPQAGAFWAELVIGLLLPLALLLGSDKPSARAMFWPSVMVVIGLILNRMNVAFTGISAPHADAYTPHWMEVAISMGVISAGVIAYIMACRIFPIFHAAPDAGQHAK